MSWSESFGEQNTFINRRDTAVILDLPGGDSVLEAVELAKHGYCPVPLFNGCAPDKSAQEVAPTAYLGTLLFRLSSELEQIRIPNDAPPVFMLDSNRMGVYPPGLSKAGMYDNRWNIFPQDMPSAEFLLEQGIKSIILRTRDANFPVANDLHHVICRYQEKGITVIRHSGVKLHMTKPRSYKNTAYRMMTLLGLRRNGLGGFGSLIPEPAEYEDGYSRNSYGRMG
jgi:hypothetical protein